MLIQTITCDRCGAYVTLDDAATAEVALVNWRAVLTFRNDTTDGKFTSRQDFCQGCMRSLNRWFCEVVEADLETS